MVWLGLVLLLLAFRRGSVLAPMVFFALPFAVPLVESFLLHSGLDLGLLIPDAIEGLTAQFVSLGGLLLLTLHKRSL